MKKALALILCVLMVFTVVPFAVSCGDEEDDTPTGAVIPAYLTTPIYNFDPAYAYNDEATMQVLSLLWQRNGRFSTTRKPVSTRSSSP